MLLRFAAGKISSIIIRLTYNALADETYRDFFLQRMYQGLNAVRRQYYGVFTSW